MPKHHELLSMQAVLERVAQEAARCGYGLVATLSAAAADAAREEMAHGVERLPARRIKPKVAA